MRRIDNFGKFLNESKKPFNANEHINKTESFKKELKELLAKYNAEIYADTEADGFSAEVSIDIDGFEIMRKHNGISQSDIK